MADIIGTYKKYFDYTVHCPKFNMNIHINTKSVMVRADATVFYSLLGQIYSTVQCTLYNVHCTKA